MPRGKQKSSTTAKRGRPSKAANPKIPAKKRSRPALGKKSLATKTSSPQAKMRTVVTGKKRSKASLTQKNLSFGKDFVNAFSLEALVKEIHHLNSQVADLKTVLATIQETILPNFTREVTCISDEILPVTEDETHR